MGLPGLPRAFDTFLFANPQLIRRDQRVEESDGGGPRHPPPPQFRSGRYLSFAPGDVSPCASGEIEFLDGYH